MLGYLFTLVEMAARPERAEAAATTPDPPADEARWVRLEQAILRTLLAFPEALRAVSQSIAELEPERSP